MDLLKIIFCASLLLISLTSSYLCCKEKFGELGLKVKHNLKKIAYRGVELSVAIFILFLGITGMGTEIKPGLLYKLGHIENCGIEGSNPDLYPVDEEKCSAYEANFEYTRTTGGDLIKKNIKSFFE